MGIAEKVAYIKGLADGLNLDDSTSEGRVLKAVVDVLADIAKEMNDMAEDLAEVTESVDDLNENVELLSEIMVDEEELAGEDDDFDEEDDDFVELQCPHCGDTIFFDPELIDSDKDLLCPACHEPVLLTTDETEGE